MLYMMKKIIKVLYCAGSVLYVLHTIFKVMELNYSKARIFSAAPRRLLIMKRRPCKA